MRPILRRSLFIGLFLLGAGWTFLSRPEAGATTAGRIPAPQAGFLAPDFTLNDLQGQSVSLAELRGQVVVINFWASWCPPCRAEMPAFQQVYARYHEQGLVILAVNASYQDAPADMQSFLDSFEHSFTVLRDEDGTVDRLYAVQALPTTFFIGRDGVIREVLPGGPLSAAGISTRVEALLEEQP